MTPTLDFAKYATIEHKELTAEEWEEKVERLKRIVENIQWKIKFSHLKLSEKVKLYKQIKGLGKLTILTSQDMADTASKMPATRESNSRSEELSHADLQEIVDNMTYLCEELFKMETNLQSMSQCLSKVKGETEESEKLNPSVLNNNKEVRHDIKIIKQDTASTKKMVMEALQALEKLSINCDQQFQEIKIENKKIKILMKKCLVAQTKHEKLFAKEDRDDEQLLQEVDTIKQETLNIVEEITEMFQTLVEFDICDDQMAEEIKIKNEENVALTKKLLAGKTTIKHTTVMFTDLLKDIGEIHAEIGGENLQISPDINGKTDEEFAVAKLYIDKIKFEIKNLIQRCRRLKVSQNGSKKKINSFCYQKVYQFF